MPVRRSRRLRDLEQSDIRRMTRECERVGGINLGQGICDLPTPPLVRDGAIEAIRARKSVYSYAEGTVELRRAIGTKLARRNDIVADPSSEIVVTVGATGAFTCAIHALLDPGDEILLLEPYYGYHLNGSIVAGLVPRFLTLRGPEFRLVESELAAAVTPATRAIVVCTPSNPSGRMLTRAELEGLERVARARDLLVITDEIYEDIRYDGRAHVPPATVPGLAERTVTIMGLSKTFSITGWRLGYAVARPEIAQAMQLVNDLYYICAPTPLQHGVAAGFEAPESFFTGLSDDYARKRERICSALDRASMPPVVPEGAYYVLADVSKLGFAGARAAAMALLEGVQVASVPGTSFFRGAEGERWLRFCFAKEPDVLDEACKRIEAFRA